MRLWHRFPRSRLADQNFLFRTRNTYLRSPCCSLVHIETISVRASSQIATAKPTFAPHEEVLLWRSEEPSSGQDEATSGPDPLKLNSSSHKRRLPVSCPGCGALAQEVEPAEAGFYTRSRKAVRAWFKPAKPTQPDHDTEQGQDGQDGQDAETLPETLKQGDSQSGVSTVNQAAPIPICDRCHDLLYNLRGTSIAHPSIEDIADSIAESPFSRNHVYHVLDAADFPMSLEPQIIRQLSLAKPRTKNRRSQQSYSYKPTLSFIITRSDLLAPTKAKVDGLMPYFQNVLRAALGRVGEKLRLGNVHLVSAKRGWWTKEIKEEIWKRGGGNWMVGKFNVGKSNLFEGIFPKGSTERADVYGELVKQRSTSQDFSDSELLSENALLPPAQPETPFPTLPIVSNLPGTTASPIRLPFRNGKGELIDLPGLGRGNLAEFVQPDHKLDLVMTNRPKTSQHTIKPGQSLLLGGGLVRITPVLDKSDPSTTMQAFPFLPIDAHVTSTEKAIGTQEQVRESGLKSILAENVGSEFKSAGCLTLDSDVTARHAGPLLRAGVSAQRLPFQVYSTDILIQGVGWVELVCQVRKRKKTPDLWEAPIDVSQMHQIEGHEMEGNSTVFKPFASALAPSQATLESPTFPSVEVFTPNGKHISKRTPLGAWTLLKEGGGKHPRAAASVRPRPSMKGNKKRRKMTQAATA